MSLDFDRMCPLSFRHVSCFLTRTALFFWYLFFGFRVFISFRVVMIRCEVFRFNLFGFERCVSVISNKSRGRAKATATVQPENPIFYHLVDVLFSILGERIVRTLGKDLVSRESQSNGSGAVPHFLLFSSCLIFKS